MKVNLNYSIEYLSIMKFIKGNVTIEYIHRNLFNLETAGSRYAYSSTNVF